MYLVWKNYKKIICFQRSGFIICKADALELGALRTEEYILTPEKYETLQNLDLNGVPLEVVCDVVAYYEANKTEDNAWVVLPIANFDCYYGNTNFSKKRLSKIPRYNSYKRSKQRCKPCESLYLKIWKFNLKCDIIKNN